MEEVFNESRAGTAIGAGRPLAGIRVLTVENFIAAPFASMWLADAGAEVVKIEAREGGDYARSTDPVRPGADGRPSGLAFLRTNRNKKSVTLDLKHPEGRRIFTELAAHADVVLENLRPNVMDRLGLGYEALSRINPRLIYGAISGFGHDDILQSPYGDFPAFDIVGQAMSGLMYRPERGDDRPTYLGFSLADIECGILALYGIVLALLHRHTTGKGKKIDISMVDASLILNEISVAMYSATKRTSPPGVHAVTAPFGTYRAKDGYIVIAVLGEHIWKRFAEVIGRPGLTDDPRFADGILRKQHVDALNVEIDAWLGDRSREAALAALRAGGVPCSNVNDVPDLFECPHVAARKMLMTLDDPAWGPIQVAGNPVKMSDVPEPDAKTPPALGEHNADVLHEWLGLDEREITTLRDLNVI
ncbi:CaiB/BaiF CoA transferase family protein [Burkholderia lata]|uniref:CaiB/BaiF CoA transferase family protein n=1 Tax=Burkholderia lata (strain ATCC 17760 / DSM 23089 / LMG 22485 / NCIMB 9086 / R18194 / 383) TaxID=482957 RepID=UPI001454A681|nr:CoA transferase [Burkholderia lata]VWB19014.1 carnitine dehydratase [Burkholderia lata]